MISKLRASIGTFVRRRPRLDVFINKARAMPRRILHHVLHRALRPVFIIVGEARSLLSEGPLRELSAHAKGRYAKHILWARITPLRTLLTMEPSQLTTHQAAQKARLLRVLALPDEHYRHHFSRLPYPEVRVPSVRQPASTTRVVMMIGTLGPGGAERQLVATAQRLHDRIAADISVACVDLTPPTNSFFSGELHQAGISVSLIGEAPRDLVALELRAQLGQLPRELDSVKDYAATLLAATPAVAHLWLDDTNVKGGIAAVMTGVPLIILSQRSLPPLNYGLHQPYMREAYRWLARAPGVRMINNSTAGARAYEEWLGLAHGAIDVIPNGYTFDEQQLLDYRAARGRYRARVGIPLGAPVVGAVMRLSEEKRPDLWLEMAARVRKAMPEVHFLIVGDGPMRAWVDDRAGRPDLAGSVHFTGHVKGAMDVIADMDLLLLTSRAEGLPNVLVEAQFVGVPVVSTPVGGAPEAVDQGKSGWVLDNDDPAHGADIIVRLMRDTEWRRSARNHGPVFAATNFGMQGVIDRIRSLYRSNDIDRTRSLK